MERIIMDISKINVPKKMVDKKPKLYKVMGMEAYLKKYHSFYGSVIVDKNYNVLDGYVIYYVAKKNEISKIPVTIVTRMDRIKRLLRRIFRKAGK